MRASYGVRVKGRFAVFTLLTPRRARQKLGITCTKAGKIIYNVTEKFARIVDNSRNNAVLNATNLVNSICGHASDLLDRSPLLNVEPTEWHATSLHWMSYHKIYHKIYIDVLKYS